MTYKSLAAALCLLAPTDAVRVRRRGVKDCFSMYDGQHLISMTPASKPLLEQMMKMITEGGCKDLSEGEGGATIGQSGQAVCNSRVADSMVSTFEDAVQILSTDAGDHFRSQSGGPKTFAKVSAFGTAASDAFYDDWRNYEDRMDRVQAAVDASGGAATIETVGNSHENRPIKAVRITGQDYQLGNPKLLFTFNVHAREWITGMAGVYAVEKMVARAKEDPSWIHGMEIVIVPMANPDGFVFSEEEDRFWRKNRRPKKGFFSCAGTDLNRNFPVDFGGRGSTSTSTCSDIFVGERALSEPESQALDKLMQEAPMSVYVDVHSFSEVILAPWMWTSSPHPRRTEALDLGARMQEAIKAKHGVVYDMGDNLLYEASGVTSDHATELGALGFTYELRPGSNAGFRGFAPPASEIRPTAEENLEGLYAAVDYARSASAKSTDSFSMFDSQYLMEVKPTSKRNVNLMNKMLGVGKCTELTDAGLQVGSMGSVICSAQFSIKLLMDFGKRVRVLQTDAGAYFRAESGSPKTFHSRGVSANDDFYADWRSYEDRMARVQTVVDQSEGVATIEEVGRSVEDRPIKAVRIRGAGYAPGKTRFLFTFNLHAREWIAGMTGVYAVEKLVAKAKADPSWVEETEIVLIPTANPDGLIYSEKENRFWRKNRRPKNGLFSCGGTDLNRNFPTDWGGKGSTSKFTCVDIYIGSKPLSEPESQTIARVMKEAPMTVMVDVHSFSALILGAWSYTSQPHPRRAEIMELGTVMANAIEDTHGFKYPMGDNLLYEASGVMSDYATELGALGFTYELRPKQAIGPLGFAPPRDQIRPTVEEAVAGLASAVDWVKAKKA